MKARIQSGSLAAALAASTALVSIGTGGCDGAGPPRASSTARAVETEGEETDTVDLAGESHGRGHTVSGEYKFPATVDPEVQADRFTELWARVYRPKRLERDRTYPLLIFLHGNHATCGRGANPRIDDNLSYTSTGMCPPGYVVAPSHAGYEYVATELATLGYIVVSINANRGINAAAGVPGDLGLNLARGRLILKHLSLLSRWNRDLEPTPAALRVSLAGRLDFDHVGLMGHSRGGEGARAAYNQYLDPESPWPYRIPDRLTIRGIFEIGPVDGQTGRTLDASGVRWAVLLPMCDGDVFNLAGIRPFDRMMTALPEQPARWKASFTVWGTNHNYFNTEWQLSDSSGCTGHPPLFSLEPGVIGSAPQRETARLALTTFFRASVGRDREPHGRRLFNPLYPLPHALTRITRVERGYNASSDPRLTLALEDFTRPTGTSKSGLPSTSSNITAVHERLPEHALTHRGARLTWTAPGAETFYQVNLTAAGSGLYLSRFDTLELRADRAADPANPPAGTNFSVQLVNADGTLSHRVPIGRFLKLRGPVGGPLTLHSMLQTARMPLREFHGAELDAIQAVRLTFDRTPAGTVLVADIRAAGSSGTGPRVSSLGDDEDEIDPVPDVVVDAETEPEPVILPAAITPAAAPRLVLGNTVRGIGPTTAAGVVEGITSDWVDVELESPIAFAEKNELLMLQIGATEIALSRRSGSGSDQQVVFTLSPEQKASLQDGDEITVRYGGPQSPLVWSFGRLDGSRLPP